MNARWLAFVVWAVVAASAAFWALRLFVSPRTVPGQAVTVGTTTAPRADLGRLFGREAAPAEAAAEPAAPSRFKLIGVITPRQERDEAVALALISIDDQPAKAYRVGSVVDGQTVLQEVRARGASLGPQGGPSMALELPPPVPAATGALPKAGAAPPVIVRPPLPVPVPLPQQAPQGEPPQMIGTPPPDVVVPPPTPLQQNNQLQ